MIVIAIAIAIVDVVVVVGDVNGDEAIRRRLTPDWGGSACASPEATISGTSS